MERFNANIKQTVSHAIKALIFVLILFPQLSNASECLACTESARTGVSGVVSFPQCCGDYPPDPSNPAICGSAPDTADADGDGIPDNLESFTEDHDGDGVVEGLDRVFAPVFEENVPLPFWTILLIGLVVTFIGYRSHKLNHAAHAKKVLHNAVLFLAFFLLSENRPLEAEELIAEQMVFLNSVSAMASGGFTITASLQTSTNPQNYNVWLEVNTGGGYQKIDASVNTASFSFLSDSENPSVRLQRCLTTQPNTTSKTLYTGVLASASAISVPVLTLPSNVNEEGSSNINWSSVSGANHYILEQRIDGESWQDVYIGNALEWSLSGAAVGNYDFRLRACSVHPTSGIAVCGDTSSVASLSIDTGANRVPKQASAPPVSTAALQASVLVGETAGNFEVDELGNAIYSIPIKAASGIAGVTPKIELVYSSDSVNGLMGLGWAISGISNISRCSQSIIDEGRSTAISWDVNDRFCLDGKRLLVSNGLTYGAVGAEYITEIDTFVKVTSLGGSLGKPDYFRVEGKDGSTRYFGETNNAKNRAINSSGQFTNDVLYWSLNRAEDNMGNGIDYYYLLDVDGHRLDKIQYGVEALIAIEYDVRPDPIKSYVSGYAFPQNKRLSKVISKQDSSELRRYEISYRPVNSMDAISKVDAIQECRDSTCWPATEFSWQFGNVGLTAQPYLPTQISGTKIILADFIPGGVRFITYNIGGDEYDYANYLRTSMPDSPFYGLGFGVYGSDSKAYRLSPQIGDWNGDGLDNVVWHRPGGRNVWDMIPIYDDSLREQIVNPIPESQLKGQLVVGDWNGDGIDDVAALNAANGVNNWFINDGSRNFSSLSVGINASDVAHGQFHVVDINADGNSDIVWTHCSDDDCAYEFAGFGTGTTGNGQIKIFINNGASGFTKITPSISPSLIDGMLYSWGDWNSDGHSDFMAYSDTTGENHWFMGDGKGDFIHYPNAVIIDRSIAYDEKVGFRFGDWNGDGLIDVLWYVSDDVAFKVGKRMLNKGSFTFSYLDNLAPTRTYQMGIYVADADGNGVDDIFYTSRSGLTAQFVDIHTSNANKQLITQFKKGLGASVSLEYNPIANIVTPLYAEPGDFIRPEYPKIWVNEARIQLVTRSAVSGGETNTVKTYGYQQLVAEAGRGILGFRQKEETNLTTGLRQNTRHKLEYPFINATEIFEVYTSDDQLLKRAVGVWDLKINPDSGSEQPYLASVTEEAFSFEAANTLLSKTITTNDYDLYGNRLLKQIETRDASDNLLKRWTQTNEYPNDLYSLEKGRTSRTLVTQHRPNSESMPTDVTNETVFTYFSSVPLKGMLQSTTIEPNYLDLSITTSYNYDGFGNKISEIATGAGVNDRRKTWVYDVDGRYLLRERNSYGQVTTTIIDRNEFGIPTRVGDINGAVTEFKYDALNRLYQTYMPNGESVTRLLEWCTGANDSGGCDASAVSAGAIFRVTESTGSGSLKYIYKDALKRDIQVDTRGFDGQFMRVTNSYDVLGRLEYQSEPYYVGSSTYQTRHYYDVLNRMTRTLHPDQSDTLYAYSGLTATTTNDQLQTHTELRNALGELVLVTDNMGGQVEYRYNPQDDLRKVNQLGSSSDPHSIATTMTYDLRGRKKTMDDPDKGSWTYDYNVFGELTLQIDANGQSIETAYDKLGRMIARTDKRANQSTESDAVWAFNNNTSLESKGLGALLTMDDTGDYQRSYRYDSLGRLEGITTALGTQGALGSFDESFTYDAYGREFQRFDASGDFRGTENFYNNYGYLNQVRESRIVNNNLSSYYFVNAMSPRGQVSQITLANGVVTSTQFEASTGRISRLSANRLLGLEVVQDLELEWDTIGNLARKQNKNRDFGALPVISYLNLDEIYNYDDLNRLKETRLNNVITQTLQYNSIGNITSKSDVGNYKYGSQCASGGFGSHAVCETDESDGIHSYQYDANGNMMADAINGAANRSFSYSVYDKPITMNKGDQQVDFDYAPDRRRYRRLDVNNTGLPQIKETLYLGTVERITQPNGSTEWKRYIGSNTIVTKTDVGQQTRFMLRDHLGSVDMILDTSGAVVQSMSFDAWGYRRSSTNYQPMTILELLSFNASETTRGFTNHEMVDSMGIIHMNGRIYDPRLARFVQADPFVPNARDTQMYNRYSYIRNNPLNAIDPSGFNPIYWIRDQLINGLASLFGAIGNFLSSIAPAISSLSRNIGRIARISFSHGKNGRSSNRHLRRIRQNISRQQNRDSESADSPYTDKSEGSGKFEAGLSNDASMEKYQFSRTEGNAFERNSTAEKIFNELDPGGANNNFEDKLMVRSIDKDDNDLGLEPFRDRAKALNFQKAARDGETRSLIDGVTNQATGAITLFRSSVEPIRGADIEGVGSNISFNGRDHGRFIFGHELNHRNGGDLGLPRGTPHINSNLNGIQSCQSVGGCGGL